MLYMLVVVLWLFMVLNATVIRSVNNELGRMYRVGHEKVAHLLF